jgi:hypothetical protein
MLLFLSAILLFSLLLSKMFLFPSYFLSAPFPFRHLTFSTSAFSDWSLSILSFLYVSFPLSHLNFSTTLSHLTSFLRFFYLSSFLYAPFPVRHLTFSTPPSHLTSLLCFERFPLFQTLPHLSFPFSTNFLFVFLFACSKISQICCFLHHFLPPPFLLFFIS